MPSVTAFVSTWTRDGDGDESGIWDQRFDARIELAGVPVMVCACSSSLITSIDVAIQAVNIPPSELGVVSSWLSQTVNNLTYISPNLSAASGGIEDADFVLETTNLAKNQILQQA